MKNLFMFWVPMNIQKVLKVKLESGHHKVASRGMSWLVATKRFSDCLWKGNLMLMYCDLWPKEFKNWIVDRPTARDFTVFSLLLTWCAVSELEGKFCKIHKIQICIRVDRYHKTTRKTMTRTTANFLHFRCLRFSNLGTWDLKKKVIQL